METMSEIDDMQADMPEQIYLCTMTDDCEVSIDAVDTGDVFWCADDMGGVKYVRADKHEALQARVDALVEYVREILTDLRESAKADLFGIEDDLKTLEALAHKESE